MRVKRGTTKNAKHKKILKLAKGYRMTYSKLYRRALEATAHAGQYSYAHRKHRKGQMREEWVETIAAALAGGDLSYSQFVNKLNKNKIEIDRKNLSLMAVNFPEHFVALVKELKS